MIDQLQSGLPELIVDLQSMSSKGLELRGELNADQCATLADNHGLETVGSFAYRLTAKRWRRDGFKISGTISAIVTQTCIATLEPVVTKINDEIEQTFLPEPDAYRRPNQDADVIEFEVDPDEPEYFNGQSVDVASIVEEYFALALPLYPRSPNADLVVIDTDKSSDEEKAEAELSPLARELLKLKQK